MAVAQPAPPIAGTPTVTSTTRARTAAARSAASRAAKPVAPSSAGSTPRRAGPQAARGSQEEDPTGCQARPDDARAEGITMKRLATLIWLLAAAPLAAQTPPAATTPQEEGAFHAEFRREGERIHDKCSAFTFKKISDCAIALATDHPLHVSFGTLAPQNGVGFGPALAMHYTPNENWRLNWSADVVGAISGAWRAGGYLKIVRTGVELPIGVHRTCAGGVG